MARSAAITDWQKGGVRYAKLKRIVPEFLEPATVHAFFVGVRNGGRFRLLNPFSPLQREFVVAVTDDEVVILSLRRPGVFRASIAGVIYRSKLEDSNVAWNNGSCDVDGVNYRPISYHDDDARHLANLANGTDS